jgi:hypothetical protein
VNSFIRQRPSTTAIVYLLLVVLLLLRVGGAVSHYCFDGMEPAVTIHFDNLSGHVQHDTAIGHTDVEKQVLSDNLLSKIFEVDLLPAIAVLFLLALLPLGKSYSYLQVVVQLRNQSKNYRPPLRAPPLYS